MCLVGDLRGGYAVSDGQCGPCGLARSPIRRALRALTHRRRVAPGPPGRGTAVAAQPLVGRGEGKARGRQTAPMYLGCTLALPAKEHCCRSGGVYELPAAARRSETSRRGPSRSVSAAHLRTAIRSSDPSRGDGGPSHPSHPSRSAPSHPSGDDHASHPSRGVPSRDRGRPHGGYPDFPIDATSVSPLLPVHRPPTAAGTPLRRG